MKRFSALSVPVCILMLISTAPDGSSAPKERAPRNQSQLDAKIIHVDKWGVYVPNMVFYWDAELGKQKVAALTATAQRHRNKLVTIVYTTEGGLEDDRRPLVVEIAPVKESTSLPEAALSPSDQSERSIHGTAEGAKVYPADSFDAASSYDAEAPPGPIEELEENGEPLQESTASIGSEPIPLVRDKPLQTPPGTTLIHQREVQMLIEHMLHLTEKKALDSLLYYYDEQVSYYGRGDVTKDYIRKDMGYYFRNWDTITCSLASDIVLVDTDRPDTRIVRFTSRFAVENSKKSLSGRTDNTWKVRKTPSGLKVIDQKQSIIRSEPQQ